MASTSHVMHRSGQLLPRIFVMADLTPNKIIILCCVRSLYFSFWLSPGHRKQEQLWDGSSTHCGSVNPARQILGVGA